MWESGFRIDQLSRISYPPLPLHLVAFVILQSLVSPSRLPTGILKNSPMRPLLGRDWESSFKPKQRLAFLKFSLMKLSQNFQGFHFGGREKQCIARIVPRQRKGCIRNIFLGGDFIGPKMALTIALKQKRKWQDKGWEDFFGEKLEADDAIARLW